MAGIFGFRALIEREQRKRDCRENWIGGDRWETVGGETRREGKREVNPSGI